MPWDAVAPSGDRVPPDHRVAAHGHGAAECVPGGAGDSNLARATLGKRLTDRRRAPVAQGSAHTCRRR